MRMMPRNVNKVVKHLSVSVLVVYGSAEMEDASKETRFVMEQSIVRMVVMKVG